MKLDLFFSILLLSAAVANAATSIQDLPSEAEVEEALEKCPRPKTPIRKRIDDLKEKQEGIRENEKDPLKKKERPKFVGTGSTLPKQIVDTTGKAFELLGHVGTALTEAKFKDKTTAASASLMKLSNAFSLRRPPIRLITSVAKNAKAIASLAKTASKVLGAIGTISSFLGPIGAGVGVIFSIASIFIPTPDPNEEVLNEMKSGFERINERFDIIEIKLEELEVTIEKTAVYADYKSNQDKLRNVMFAYRQFSAVPNKITLKTLQESCYLFNPQLTLAWIHRHVVLKQVGAELLPTILKAVEYDRDGLVDWLQIIMTDALHASFLQEVCIGVRFGQGVTGTQQRGRRSNMQRAVTNTNSQLPAIVDRSELFCAVNYSREVTDTMMKEIVKKLDAVELELLETFDKVQLEKDLKKWLLDTSGGDPCLIKDQIKQQLNSKYYWLNWWVAVSPHEKRPKVTSLDGHFAQYEASVIHGDKSKKVWITVVGSELDTIVPNLNGQRISWTPGTTIPFYENRPKKDDGSITLSDYPSQQDNNNIEDNIVEIYSESGRDGYLCHPKDFSDIKNFAFYFSNNALRNNFDSNSHEVYKRLYISYKSRYLPNSAGCKIKADDLLKKETNRHSQCSAVAFKRLIQNELEYNIKYNSWGDQWDTDLAKAAFNHLNTRHTESTWNVIIAYNHLESTCTDEHSNCVEVKKPGSPQTVMTVVWSTKCNQITYVTDTKNFSYKFMKNHERELFGPNPALKDVKEFIADPQEYIRKKEIPFEGETKKEAEQVSFFGNKVLVFEDGRQIGTTMEGEDSTKVFGDIKNLKIFMSFFEPYDNPNCEI